MTTSTRSARPTKKAGKASKAKKPAPTKVRPRARATAAVRGSLAGSAHVTPGGSNVFADLGFEAEEAENLKVRAQLMSELRRLIETRGLTQAEAGALLGVAQPRVSDLTRGKIGLFTIDALVNMLAHAGAGVSISVTLAVA